MYSVWDVVDRGGGGVGLGVGWGGVVWGVGPVPVLGGDVRIFPMQLRTNNPFENHKKSLYALRYH